MANAAAQSLEQESRYAPASTSETAEQPVQKTEITEEKPKMDVVEMSAADGTSRWEATLLNGQKANVAPLSRPDFIAGQNSTLKHIEMNTAAASKSVIDEPKGVNMLKDQLQESRADGEEIKTLRAIFEAFGPQVYLLGESEPGGKDKDGRIGLDTAGLGHKVDFAKGMNCVIAASRAEEMQRLFRNPPQLSGTESASPFTVMPWNHLDNDGFVVKHGDDTIIRFLYAQDDGVKSMESIPTAPVDEYESDPEQVSQET